MNREKEKIYTRLRILHFLQVIRQSFSQPFASFPRYILSNKLETSRWSSRERVDCLYGSNNRRTVANCRNRRFPRSFPSPANLLSPNLTVRNVIPISKFFLAFRGIASQPTSLIRRSHGGGRYVMGHEKKEDRLTFSRFVGFVRNRYFILAIAREIYRREKGMSERCL